VRGEWLAWNKEKQQKAAAGQAKPNANAGSSCCLTKKARSGFRDRWGPPPQEATNADSDSLLAWRRKESWIGLFVVRKGLEALGGPFFGSFGSGNVHVEETRCPASAVLAQLVSWSGKGARGGAGAFKNSC